MKKEIEVSMITNWKLWKAFKNEFHDFTEFHFRVNRIEIEEFRFMLRKREVWIQTKNMSAVTTFLNTLKKEKSAQWSSKKIQRCYQRKEFVSYELSKYVKKMKTTWQLQSSKQRSKRQRKQTERQRQQFFFSESKSSVFQSINRSFVSVR